MKPELGGGDLLDFKETFKDYYGRVFKQLIYITKDFDTAEDLTQEVFIKLYKNPLRDESNIGAWLAQVAKNTAYNHIRGEKRRVMRESKVYALEGVPIHTSFPLKEDIMDVQDILSKMSKRERTILILKHSGCTYREIAKVIGVSNTSVGTLIARAQKKFKQLYEGGK